MKNTIYKDRLEEIKVLLKTGEITREEAVEQSKKPLAEMNKRMAEISKEYGMRHTPITFVRFMR